MTWQGSSSPCSLHTGKHHFLTPSNTSYTPLKLCLRHLQSRHVPSYYKLIIVGAHTHTHTRQSLNNTIKKFLSSSAQLTLTVQTSYLDWSVLFGRRTPCLQRSTHTDALSHTHTTHNALSHTHTHTTHSHTRTCMNMHRFTMPRAKPH